MHVRVDEPRCDEAAGCIELGTTGLGDVAEPHDAIADDRDVGSASIVARAVDHGAAADDEIDAHGLTGGPPPCDGGPQTAHAWTASSTRSTGACSRSMRMNSRIQAGWSGQARAETISPSTTPAPSSKVAPAASTSGSSAG